jgi:NAD-reducing hydrogenase small subunit
MADNPTIAAISLTGCFGCHLTLPEVIDDRIAGLLDQAQTEDGILLGLVEGGCTNEDDVRTLQEFRGRCRILIAVGDCAITGGVPAMRNAIPLKECFEETYVNAPSVRNPDGLLPNDPALPRMLDRVYPCAEVVRVDHSIPGCPPSLATLQAALAAILTGKPVELPYKLIRYD